MPSRYDTRPANDEALPHDRREGLVAMWRRQLDVGSISSLFSVAVRAAVVLVLDALVLGVLHTDLCGVTGAVVGEVLCLVRAEQ